MKDFAGMYYEDYLKAVNESDGKVPPSMIETELKILRDCDNAREHLFNGRSFFTNKKGGLYDFYSNHPNAVINAYSMNAKGKVVRLWANKHTRSLPDGDGVSESIVFDQISLNTLTPSIWKPVGPEKR